MEETLEQVAERHRAMLEEQGQAVVGCPCSYCVPVHALCNERARRFRTGR